MSKKLIPYYGLYSNNTATKMDLVAVDGANGGFKARTQYIKESK